MTGDFLFGVFLGGFTVGVMCMLAFACFAITRPDPPEPEIYDDISEVRR